MRNLPRRLVDLFAKIEADGIDLYHRSAEDRVRTLPEWKPFEGDGHSELASGISTLDALRALGVAKDPGPKLEATLVLTLPRMRFSEALETDEVANDLIAQARESLLVLAYELTDQAFLSRLHEFARQDSRQLRIVGNHDTRIQDTQARWPADCRPEDVEFHEYIKREDIAFGEGPGSSRYYPVLHAKVIVADRKRCLIGSANFTRGGMRNNVEAGLRVDSAEIADQLWSFSERLIALPVCRRH